MPSLPFGSAAVPAAHREQRGDAREPAALDDPHRQAVRQLRLRDHWRRQRLVLAERRQVLRQCVLLGGGERRAERNRERDSGESLHG